MKLIPADWKSFKAGNPIAKEIIESYAGGILHQASGCRETIEVVTYIAAEGDISTDLLSTE